MARLERQIGQQTVEIDFLKGCWQGTEEQRMLQAWTGKPRSMQQMAEQGQGIGAMTAGCAVDLKLSVPPAQNDIAPRVFPQPAIVSLS